MELTILRREGQFFASLYEKPLTLYLCTPPHSSLDPGCSSGLVIGMFFQDLSPTYSNMSQDGLNSVMASSSRQRIPSCHYETFICEDYQKAEHYTSFRVINNYFKRRFYLKLLFRNNLFLHLKYFLRFRLQSHSNFFGEIQYSLQPLDKTHLIYLRNYFGGRQTNSRLVIAYTRYHNIGNALS